MTVQPSGKSFLAQSIFFWLIKWRGEVPGSFFEIQLELGEGKSGKRSQLLQRQRGRKIGLIDNEPWVHMPPACSGLKHIVYDPQNRLHGSMKFHQPFSDAGFDFPIVCGEQFKVTRF